MQSHERVTRRNSDPRRPQSPLRRRIRLAAFSQRIYPLSRVATYENRNYHIRSSRPPKLRQSRMQNYRPRFNDGKLIRRLFYLRLRSEKATRRRGREHSCEFNIARLGRRPRQPLVHARVGQLLIRRRRSRYHPRITSRINAWHIILSNQYQC